MGWYGGGKYGRSSWNQSMARIRSKPDFTAGFVTWIGGKALRALELRVKGDDLYAMQPRHVQTEKVSYHASGQSHIKVGNSKPILPFQKLPPRFLKEEAHRLRRERYQLFTISLENAPTLLPYTGQEYDTKIDLHVPQVDGTVVLQLYVGSDSGQKALFEIQDYVETTVTERSLAGAGYEFCIRLAVLTSNGGYRRPFDHDVSAAWQLAGAELGIRVVAPFPLITSGGDDLLYEAYLPDFGGQLGTIIGIARRNDGDHRQRRGYWASDLSDQYRRYDENLFKETLNDWGWFGSQSQMPTWYGAKDRS